MAKRSKKKTEQRRRDAEHLSQCIATKIAEGMTPEEAARACASRGDDAGRVYRYDVGRLDRAERTGAGGVRVPAFVTRTGVLTYRNADGTERLEFRPAEEVFAADSLRTLRGVPVTDLHPPDAVNTDNWQEHSIGHVGDSVRQAGEHIAAEVIVNDAEAITKIDAGDRSEISAGYTMRLDSTPGTHQGKRYDAVQRDIRYNHVAIGPAGWGRAGAGVALRLDSGDAVCVPEEDLTVKMIRIDGKDYEHGSDAHFEKLEEMHKTELSTATEASATATTRADKAEGERDQLETDLEAAKDPKLLEERIVATAKFRVDAQSILGEDFDPKGKSERDVMVEAIKRHDAGFDPKDRSDDYLRGRFELLVTAARADGLADLRRAADGSDNLDPDADPEPDAVKARKDMRADQQDRASKPLALSKDR